MRLFLLIVVLSLLSCAPAFASPGLVQVSNFAEAPDAAAAIMPGQSFSSAFVTGPYSAWKLHSITVEFTSYSNYSAKLYANSVDGRPGELIAIAPTQSGLVLGTATLTFFFSALQLNPSTKYWIVVESHPNLGFVLATTSHADVSPSGWSIENQSFIGVNGPTWISHPSPMRLEVDAAPVTLPLAITSVHGCYEAAPGTVDCPNGGAGLALVVRGQSFTPDTVILVGGVPVETTFISPAELNCPLPAGAGRNLPVAVVDSPESAVLLGALSYADPACIGDADGNGVVNFEDITGVLANFNRACP